jgi:hypothetical protein
MPYDYTRQKSPCRQSEVDLKRFPRITRSFDGKLEIDQTEAPTTKLSRLTIVTLTVSPAVEP